MNQNESSIFSYHAYLLLQIRDLAKSERRWKFETQKCLAFAIMTTKLKTKC
jgi:hypothetical protein